MCWDMARTATLLTCYLKQPQLKRVLAFIKILHQAVQVWGLCQHDAIAFKDIIQRTPRRFIYLIEKHFGCDITKLKHTSLANDPLLSFIFCRLHYRLRPEPIPSSLRGRAEYWKQFYNSMAGKGTVTHYLDSANTYLYCLTPSDLSTPPCP